MENLSANRAAFSRRADNGHGARIEKELQRIDCRVGFAMLKALDCLLSERSRKRNVKLSGTGVDFDRKA